jgi:hypothetical protein
MRYQLGMTKLLALLLAFLWSSSAFAAARSVAQETGQSWSLQFQSGFENAKIIVFADNERVFSGPITTEPTTGLAKVVLIPVRGPLLHLYISISSSRKVLERTVDIRKGRNLGVQFNFHVGYLELNQRALPFLYD